MRLMLILLLLYCFKDQLQVISEEEDFVVTLETEVWSWGKNNKGQLGHGDEIDR